MSRSWCGGRKPVTDRGDILCFFVYTLNWRRGYANSRHFARKKEEECCLKWPWKKEEGDRVTLCLSIIMPIKQLLSFKTRFFLGPETKGRVFFKKAVSSIFCFPRPLFRLKLTRLRNELNDAALRGPYGGCCSIAQSKSRPKIDGRGRSNPSLLQLPPFIYAHFLGDSFSLPYLPT